VQYSHMGSIANTGYSIADTGYYSTLDVHSYVRRAVVACAVFLRILEL
jgi:hypothetical protein